MTKKVKSVLFVVALVGCLFLGVMGWHFADLADTPFWWKFWGAAALASIALFVFLTRWFSKSRKKW